MLLNFETENRIIWHGNEDAMKDNYNNDEGDNDNDDNNNRITLNNLYINTLDSRPHSNR